MAIGRNLLDDLAEEIGNHGLILLPEFRAHAGPCVGLGSAFVIAHLDKVGLHAEFVEQALVKHDLGAETRDHQFAGRREDDFVTRGRQKVIPGRGAVQIGVDFFAGFAQLDNRSPQLINFAQANRGAADLQHDRLELFVFAGPIEAAEQIDQVRLKLAE